MKIKINNHRKEEKNRMKEQKNAPHLGVYCSMPFFLLNTCFFLKKEKGSKREIEEKRGAKRKTNNKLPIH